MSKLLYLSGIKQVTMQVHGTVVRVLQAGFVVVIIALLAGQLLGQPILLSFVTTESMEPTLESGDGFVALPPELAGDVDEGDVIVFSAEEVQGGGLTTHRVVEETEDGYVTKGDANPFTDQDGGEPHVRDAEVVAVAAQPGGSVLTIPHLGTAVGAVQSVVQSLQQSLARALGMPALLGTQGLAYLLFALSAVLYVVAGRFEPPERRERTRTRTRGTSPKLLLAGLTLVVVCGVTAAMVVPAETEEFGIISAEFESESPDVVKQGTSESYAYPVANDGVVPVVVILESDSENIETDPQRLTVEGGTVKNATVTITAPPETGTNQAFLSQHRYLHVLPAGVIQALHDVHPWLPIAVIDLLVASPFYLTGRVLLGRGRIRSRPSRPGSWL